MIRKWNIHCASVFHDFMIGRLPVFNADVALKEFSVSSKLNAEWAFLKHLHDVGYRTAQVWLDENYEALGNRSTLDIDAVY